MALVQTSASAETQALLEAALTHCRLAAIQQIGLIVQAKNQMKGHPDYFKAEVGFTSEKDDGKPKKLTRLTDAIDSLPMLKMVADLPKHIISGEIENMLTEDWTGFQPWMTPHLFGCNSLPAELARWSRSERCHYFLPGGGKSMLVEEGYGGEELDLKTPSETFILRSEKDFVMNLTPGPTWDLDTLLCVREDTGLRIRPLARKRKSKIPKINNELVEKLLQRALLGDQRAVDTASRHMDRVNRKALSGWLPGMNFLIRGSWYGDTLVHKFSSSGVEIYADYFSGDSGFQITKEEWQKSVSLWLVAVHTLLHQVKTFEPIQSEKTLGKRSARVQNNVSHQILDPDQLFVITHHKSGKTNQTTAKTSGGNGIERDFHVRTEHMRRKWGHSKLPPEQQEWILIEETEVRPDKKGQPGLRPGYTIKIT